MPHPLAQPLSSIIGSVHCFWPVPQKTPGNYVTWTGIRCLEGGVPPQHIHSKYAHRSFTEQCPLVATLKSDHASTALRHIPASGQQEGRVEFAATPSWESILYPHTLIFSTRVSRYTINVQLSLGPDNSNISLG